MGRPRGPQAAAERQERSAGLGRTLAAGRLCCFARQLMAAPALGWLRAEAAPELRLRLVGSGCSPVRSVTALRGFLPVRIIGA